MPEPDLRAYERRYLSQGHVAHLVSVVGLYDMETKPAECGLSPGWPFGWHGTGSQAEYDHAELLPLCRRCLGQLPSSTLEP